MCIEELCVARLGVWGSVQPEEGCCFGNRPTASRLEEVGDRHDIHLLYLIPEVLLLSGGNHYLWEGRLEKVMWISAFCILGISKSEILIFPQVLEELLFHSVLF